MTDKLSVCRICKQYVEFHTEAEIRACVGAATKSIIIATKENTNV